MRNLLPRFPGPVAHRGSQAIAHHFDTVTTDQRIAEIASLSSGPTRPDYVRIISGFVHSACFLDFHGPDIAVGGTILDRYDPPKLGHGPAVVTLPVLMLGACLSADAFEELESALDRLSSHSVAALDAIVDWGDAGGFQPQRVDHCAEYLAALSKNAPRYGISVDIGIADDEEDELRIVGSMSFPLIHIPGTHPRRVPMALCDHAQ